MSFVLIFVLIMAGMWIWQMSSSLPGSIQWRANQSWRRAKQRLCRATTMELLEQVRDCLRFERWQNFSCAETLLTNSTWTDLTLRQALESLVAELLADDKLHERRGRDSNGFEVFDSGLGLILEVLQARTAGRQSGG